MWRVGFSGTLQSVLSVPTRNNNFPIPHLTGRDRRLEARPVTVCHVISRPLFPITYFVISTFCSFILSFFSYSPFLVSFNIYFLDSKATQNNFPIFNTVRISLNRVEQDFPEVSFVTVRKVTAFGIVCYSSDVVGILRRSSAAFGWICAHRQRLTDLCAL